VKIRATATKKLFLLNSEAAAERKSLKHEEEENL